MRIVFFGTAEFGIHALDLLVRHGHDIHAVVSAPPRPKGRGLAYAESPIAIHARQMGITAVLTPENLKSPECVGALKESGADLFVVVAFRILPQEIFSIPSSGTYNIHASLLPRYRGPAPVQRAIENGETQTGVTVFRIDAGIDTGSIILRKSVCVGNDETAPQLSERLSGVGAHALVEAISQIESGNVQYEFQDEACVTHAPKLRKAEGKIDWNQPAQSLYNKIRAFKPFPGTYTYLNGRQLDIEWAYPLDFTSDNEPGVITGAGSDGFDVQCRGNQLRVVRLKLSGKKSMDAAVFLRGTPLSAGDKLG